MPMKSKGKQQKSLNPAQLQLLNELRQGIVDVVKSVEKRQAVTPLAEGQFTANVNVCGLSPTVEILYSGVRVVIPVQV